MSLARVLHRRGLSWARSGVTAVLRDDDPRTGTWSPAVEWRLPNVNVCIADAAV